MVSLLFSLPTLDCGLFQGRCWTLHRKTKESLYQGLRAPHRVSNTHLHHFPLLDKVRPSTLKRQNVGFLEAMVELLLVRQMLYLLYLWNQQSSSNNLRWCWAVNTVELACELLIARSLTFPVYKHLGNKISALDSCIWAGFWWWTRLEWVCLWGRTCDSICLKLIMNNWQWVTRLTSCPDNKTVWKSKYHFLKKY